MSKESKEKQATKPTLPRGYTLPSPQPKPKKQIPDNNTIVAVDDKNSKNNNEGINLTDPLQPKTTDKAFKEVIQTDKAKEVIAREDSSNTGENSMLKEKPKEQEITKEDRKINNNDLGREGIENLVDRQKQQIEKTRSNISNTTNRINDNINNNKYKETNNEIIKKSIDTADKYQQEFNRINQNVTDNTIDTTRRLNEFVLGYTENFNNQ